MIFPRSCWGGTWRGQRSLPRSAYVFLPLLTSLCRDSETISVGEQQGLFTKEAGWQRFFELMQAFDSGQRGQLQAAQKRVETKDAIAKLGSNDRAASQQCCGQTLSNKRCDTTGALAKFRQAVSASYRSKPAAHTSVWVVVQANRRAALPPSPAARFVPFLMRYRRIGSYGVPVPRTARRITTTEPAARDSCLLWGAVVSPYRTRAPCGQAVAPGQVWSR